MRLALDAMGGDNAPEAAVEGGVLFAQEFPGDELVLVGDSSALERLLKELYALKETVVTYVEESLGAAP